MEENNQNNQVSTSDAYKANEKLQSYQGYNSPQVSSTKNKEGKQAGHLVKSFLYFLLASLKKLDFELKNPRPRGLC